MAFKGRSGRKPKMGAKAYPLRKIVGERMVPILLASGKESEYLVRHEVLECGHTMPPRADFVGETNAGKRRCRQCWKESNADLCAQCGKLKHDSTMHHDAPGTNWGAALHWFQGKEK
jgi:uncharacterized UBP type Zn finger protein